MHVSGEAGAEIAFHRLETTQRRADAGDGLGAGRVDQHRQVAQR
jgi:hypothetical protein